MLHDLNSIQRVLERLAPPALAESWDNTGWIIRPATPRPMRRVLLTIDLTNAVAQEAVRSRVDLVVAYHPPIFEGVKSFDPSAGNHAGLMRLIAREVAVYSPHTALDAVPGGINDWLADGLKAAAREPIKSSIDPASQVRTLHYKMVVFAPRESADAIRAAMAAAGAGTIGHYAECSFNLDGIGTFRGDQTTHPAVGRRGRLERVPETRIEMVCPAGALDDAIEAVRRSHPYEEPALDVVPLRQISGPVMRGAGQGRLLRYPKPVAIGVLVERIKRWLGLRAVRLALSPRHAGTAAKVRSVAVCAGAGASVLRQSRRDPEVFLTGEMRHHDILAANASGTSVILTDHTHSERGYLPVFRDKLRAELGRSVAIRVAAADREPLRVV
jgi:dinuclear metal center YbgI/SA1388 family protein